MSSRNLLKRRELMLSMGAAGFLAVPLFRESFVEAQTSSFPTRFVVLHLAGGVYHPDGGPEGPGTWTFDKVLKPMASLQSEIIQMNHCNNEAASEMWSHSGEPHGAAMRGLLTGDSSVQIDAVAKWGPTDSVDQQIAAKIGGNSKFQSLQFGIETSGGEIDKKRLIIKGGNALPQVDSPATMFARLFSDFMPGTQPTATATVPGSAPPPVGDASARDRSILDLLMNEVKALKSVSGVYEQQKLDQHLESLRGLEQQLGPVPSPGGSSGSGTTAPQQVVGVGCAAPNVGNESDVPTQAKQQFDLLYQSLVCDLTRVASVQILSSAQGGVTFPYVGVSKGHHDLEHSFDPQIDLVQTYFVQHMADFLNRLKATPEGGGTMLDNTLVLVCSEFGAAGAHDHSFFPAMTVGRGGGNVTPGRTIDFGDSPHNLMLRSLMQVFGITTSIGEAKFNSGSVISLS